MSQASVKSSPTLTPPNTGSWLPVPARTRTVWQYSSRVRNTVGIFGASGTTGVELVHRLERHPKFNIAFATSRTHAGSSLRVVDPGAPDICLEHPDEVDLDLVDAVLLALPHGHSPALVEKSRALGKKVIDLAGDFRLQSQTAHQRIYGTGRPEKIMGEVVYGLSEMSRSKIADASLIANPGCYPTCTAFALYPLAANGGLPDIVTIDAKSGISGAGRAATPDNHYCAVADDVRPYALGRAHRHATEIEQLLSQFGADHTRVIFCPHVVPLERGMLVTCTLESASLTALEVHELYREAYQGESFIEVLEFNEPARIRAVVRTNRVVVGIHPVEGTRHIVITCAIDNLVKGAAGQAIQNLNVMFGFDDRTGF